MTIRLFKGTVDSRYNKVLRPEKWHCDIGIELYQCCKNNEIQRNFELWHRRSLITLLEWNIIISVFLYKYDKIPV